MSAINVKGLQIAYESNRKEQPNHILLDNLNVSFLFGECVALIGPNGAGKSSLLRVLAGLQEPQKGSVYWNKSPLVDISLSDRPRYLSIMFSNYQRISGMTVKDVVAMGRQPYTGVFGKMASTDWDAVKTSLARIGMTDLASNTIENLSDGEFRKVMLAKKWAQDAKVMLFDEPTSHLDFPSSLEYVKLLKSAAAEDGKAILFSSHNLPLAFKFADKILVLGSDGDTAFGKPEEIVQTQTFKNILGSSDILIDPSDLSFKYNS